ncbi:TIM barrel protein [Tessaracoccus sp. HDW20]|nr:TIM barrel protein [Tessaracoccus coleopterorum]
MARLPVHRHRRAVRGRVRRRAARAGRLRARRRHAGGPRPLPTIADAGDDARKARPGGAPELQLSGAAWDLFVARLERVAAHVRSLGLEPTFHHHAVTYIETPAEIDAFLRDTSMGLTFDTGHLLLGGATRRPTSSAGRPASTIST